MAPFEIVRLPDIALSVVLKKSLGIYPKRPWVPTNALRALRKVVRPDWEMVEFGSGMSTLWWASRVASVHSIESDPGWYSRLNDAVPANVRLELRSEERYASLTVYDDHSLDLVVVDGIQRGACTLAALEKVRPGGWIYLDNSDKDMTIPEGHVRVAEQAILDEVERRAGIAQYFTGPTPGLLGVTQGMLAHL